MMSKSKKPDGEGEGDGSQTTTTTSCYEQEITKYQADLSQCETNLQDQLERLHLVHDQMQQQALERPERAAKLARMAAAQAAIQLATELLAQDDRTALNQSIVGRELKATANKLEREIKGWKRTGRGWFEDRVIKRAKIAFVGMMDAEGNPIYERDRDGKIKHDKKGKPIQEIEPKRVEFRYGPYRYFRWRAGGKTKTHYLGRVSSLPVPDAANEISEEPSQ